MTITAEMIASVRRKTGETTTTTYTDADIEAVIEASQVQVSRTFTATDDWIINASQSLDDLEYIYDLYRAAATIWEEKLAKLVEHGSFDVSGAGGSFSRSQIEQQYQRRLSYCLSRRYPTSVVIASRGNSSLMR